MADIAKKRVSARLARHARIRRKVSGSAERPRLCVRRTLKNMIAQVIDDNSGVSLVQLSTNGKSFQEEHGSLNKTEQSHKLGEQIAETLKAKGITNLVFDRGGYIFHGRIKAVADGAKAAGLEF
jgi:large subunit ribosomal protein L18